MAGAGNLHVAGGKPLAGHENPWKTIAPSALPFAPDWHVPEALTKSGLVQVRSQFV